MFRVLLALVTALALVLGSMAGASAGVDGGGDGTVDVGGNGNGSDQNNEQNQTQDQEPDQDSTQGTGNDLGQGNDQDASAGGNVDNGCVAAQDGDDGESGDDADDDTIDDSVECDSGDAATGDSSIGDSNQANSGNQSGSSTTGQTGTQNGGNQANAPSNTTDQTIDADIDDIGGDDNDVDNSGSINDNAGDIDQSEDTGVIEGDGNELGGADALLTFLLALLVSLFGGADTGQPGLPPVVQACNQLTTSGGQGTTNTGHQLGVSGPTSFLLQYEMFRIPDQLQVFYEGAVIFDTGGLVSNSRTVTVNVPAGSATTVTVRLSAPQAGTEWNYTVSCPSS